MIELKHIGYRKIIKSVYQINVLGLLVAIICTFTGCAGILKKNSRKDFANSETKNVSLQVPTLKSKSETINKAFRIAIGDIIGNVQPFRNGILKHPVLVFNAGLDYNRPWTRDASINAWNGTSLLWPNISRNTLFSVLKKVHGKLRIGGQYWDSIVWATGAWSHYLSTGDKQFLKIAFEAVKNSLKHLEATEFDSSDNLFRGPGWSDGIAAYPEKYGKTGGSSSILDWVKANPKEKVNQGYGIPMKALSTNCLYYNAYRIIEKMAKELNIDVKEDWDKRAFSLKQEINKKFWIEEKEYYRFITGPFGDYDYQEALGQAYVLEFGIADSEGAKKVLKNQYVAPAGVPCIWPKVPRYDRNKRSFGRHSGTVWPQIQGIWAVAAERENKHDIFYHEFKELGQHAVRDMQFAEIYHPITGKIYGGLQERDGKIVRWNATNRQTWSATAYLRMLLLGIIGLHLDSRGITFTPFVPFDIGPIEFSNLRYRNSVLDIEIEGHGGMVDRVFINGKRTNRAFLDQDMKGKTSIKIIMELNEKL